jgi:cellulose synthase/poly-beta-1,6-N-acetylglucosamine synthase-like glycosyltransferase
MVGESTENKLVHVAIPYCVEDKQLAENAKFLHKIKAGIPCVVTGIEDKEKKGWVASHNRFIEHLQFDYYCYSAADYIPGDDYLKIAIEALEKSGKGLCGFNDGKWDGKIATAGVITRDFFLKYGLFYDGYKSHGADNEITDFAIDNNEYIYEPKAILAELEERKINKNPNVEDQKLYANRRNC